MFSHNRFVRPVISTLILSYNILSSDNQQACFAGVKDARGHAAEKH